MSETKIISQKIVFSSDKFEVKEIKISLPKEKIRSYNIVDRKPSVFIFPITDSYEIYLIKQYRFSMEKTVLEAVAGFVNEGESVLLAAKRELEEETGLTANQWEEFARIDMAHSVIRAQSYLFLAKDLLIGDPIPEEDEEISLIKMPLKKAVEKIMNHEISDAGSISGLLMLERLRKNKKI